MVVAWLPPVIEQLRPGEGNLRKIFSQFTDPGEPFIGTRAAIKAMVGRFNLLGPWLLDARKDPRSDPNYVGFVLFVALVGAALWWAWRRRERIEVSLFAVLVLATVLGLLSTVRIFGPFFDYVIRWMSPLVAMWVAASIWSFWLTWRARRPAGSGDADLTRAAVLGLASIVVVAGVGVVRARDAEVPFERDIELTEALSAQLERSLDPAERYQVNEVDPVSFGSVAFGLALELPRHGVHAGVGPWGVAGAMPFRVVTDEQADSTLWYVAGAPAIEAFATADGAVVRAQADVRSPPDVQRSDQLETQLMRALCDSGHADLRHLLFSRWGHTTLAFAPGVTPEVKKLLDQYTALRQPAAVVELPVGVSGYEIAPQLPPC
jgi:hypothetical protein